MRILRPKDESRHQLDCGLRFRGAALAPLRLGCRLRPGRRDAAFALCNPFMVYTTNRKHGLQG